MSLDTTKRGELVIDNKVTPSTLIDVANMGLSDSNEHQQMLRYYEPDFETTLREVSHEVYIMRIAGKLRPFVEGEPIGAYKKLPQPKKATAKEVREYHLKSRRWAREEMLALRSQNDTIIRSYLK